MNLSILDVLPVRSGSTAVPLQVVERFSTLEAIHPGRIDLGIGRAAGTDPLAARALRSV